MVVSIRKKSDCPYVQGNDHLLVQSWANDGGYEVREVRRAFIKLKPANHTMIGKIFCDARLRDAEMLGKLRLEGIGATTAGTAAQEIADRNAQRLAGFDVVIAGEIGIREDENAGSDGRVIGFVQFYGGTGQQATKLHFEKREP